MSTQNNQCRYSSLEVMRIAECAICVHLTAYRLHKCTLRQLSKHTGEAIELISAVIDVHKDCFQRYSINNDTIFPATEECFTLSEAGIIKVERWLSITNKDVNFSENNYSEIIAKLSSAIDHVIELINDKSTSDDEIEVAMERAWNFMEIGLDQLGDQAKKIVLYRDVLINRLAQLNDSLSDRCVEKLKTTLHSDRLEINSYREAYDYERYLRSLKSD